MKTFFSKLKRNWWKLIRIEIVFAILRGLIYLPLCNALIKLSLSTSGLKRITPDTILRLVRNPVTILSGIVLLALTALLTLAEISTVLVCLHERSGSGKTGIFDMICEGVKRSCALARARNWFLLPFMLIMVPFTGLFNMTGVITSLNIPEFTLDVIEKEPRYYIPAGIGFVIMMIVVLLCSFVFHGMLLKGESFFKAAKESGRILRGRLIRLVIRIALATLMVALPLSLITGVIDLVGFGVIRLVIPEASRYTAAMVLCMAMGTLNGFITDRMALPVTYTMLSSEYERISALRGEACDLTVTYPAQPGKRRRVFYAVILTAVIIGTVSLARDIADPGYFNYVGPEITAHRGSSVNKPENNIPAFEQAIEDKADWIELDVHQTKDGVIVVTHDDNLKRIAGVNIKITDLTYDELMQYDVGSWFSQEFSGLRVASLDEVLKLCKDKIRVNIELKPTGLEKDFEEGVIAVVRENGFENDCVLASLKVNSVRRCKELAPDIKTLLLLTYAQGDLSEYTFADGISVEESSVTEALVRNAHINGKTIIAWTINRTSNVEPLVEAGVDGIITDDPVLIREAALEAMKSSYGEFVELFFKPGEETEALRNMDGEA